MLTTAQIGKLLEPYGVESSTEFADKIRDYVELLLKWNHKLALTTVTDPVQVVKFHFGESLFAISTGAFGKSRLADVGTGAGFPGLALAVADSNLHVNLIESNLRKCAFLAEVIRELKISNAAVLTSRMESLDGQAGDFDVITARALGHFDELLTWSRMRLAPNGRVLLWLGEDDVQEISVRSKWIWRTPVQIPGSARRYILQGSPSHPTA
jgi:16S rRNA (guanine527-N7)-methyltransferase